MSTGPRQYAPLAGLFVVSLGASLATMDLAVNVAFPSITAAFALETRSIRWVVICHVLTYSSLMLAFGKLGDRIGYRRVFRAGLLVSVLAFVLCALAANYQSLLAARILQGVATALTALLHIIESRESASGASEAAAFADASVTVFLYAALLLVAFFALSGLRRRTWFGG